MHGLRESKLKLKLGVNMSATVRTAQHDAVINTLTSNVIEEIRERGTSITHIETAAGFHRLLKYGRRPGMRAAIMPSFSSTSPCIMVTELTA